MEDEFAFNHFWHKKLKSGKNVLCTENGSWTVLDDEEYGRLRAGEVFPETPLFKKLESHGVLLTKNNCQSIVQRTRTRFGYIARGVTLHIIAVTLRCDHNCIYCHAKSVSMDKNGLDMDAKTACKAVDFVFQAPSKSLVIEFQGGEPLANFEAIQAVVERSNELSKKTGKKIAFNIVSNFSLLNDEKLNFLVTNNFGICTSLDGPKKVHDFNRRLSSGSSYDRVVKWIGVIKNELKYPLNALPTVTRHSLSFPREIVDEYVRLGFDVVRARGLNNAGVASGAWRQIGYSPEKFLEFWKSVSDYCFELNCKGKAKIREGIVSLIAEKITSEKSLAYACFGAPCGAALMQAAYDHEGNVYACDEARSFEEFKIGNFKKQSYSDVFASQTALNLVDLSSGLKGMCDACAWHPYCGPCMVCSYGSQGSVIPKLAVDHECKVRKGMVTYVFEKLVEGGADAEIMRRWITPKKE